MTKPTKEQRLLAKLGKLKRRRDYHVWWLGDVDRQIGLAVRALADVRRVSFLRVDDVLREVGATEGREVAGGN
jgi:hypothetical protein